jgi:hypothetical protein
MRVVLQNVVTLGNFSAIGGPGGAVHFVDSLLFSDGNTHTFSDVELYTYNTKIDDPIVVTAPTYYALWSSSGGSCRQSVQIIAAPGFSADVSLSGTFVGSSVTLDGILASYTSDILGMGTSLTLLNSAPTPIFKGSGSSLIGQRLISDGFGRYLWAGRPYVIWQPGVPSAGDHVATWGEVATYITNTAGLIDVYVDTQFSFGSATVTVATPTVNCQGKTKFKGVVPVPLTVDLALPNMFFETNAQILNPFSFEDLQLQNTSGDFNMVVGTNFGFSLTNCSVSVASASWTVAPLRLSMYHGEIHWVNSGFGSFFPPSTVPVIDADGSSEIFLYVERSATTLSTDYWAYMVGAAFGTWVHLLNDDSVRLPVQVLNVGGVNSIQPLTHPYSGLTAARPDNPRVGEEYFDTTLNRPVWFDGINWIKADGTVV